MKICDLRKKKVLYDCHQVDVDVINAGPSGQAGHGGHWSDQRKQESGSNGRPHIPDRKDESGRSALEGRIGAEGVLGLGHADGQVVEALALVAVDGRPGPNVIKLFLSVVYELS